MTVTDKSMKDEQSEFWRGEFGNTYVERNAANAGHIKGLLPLWAEILTHTATQPPKSFMEVGPNIGLNLRTLRQLTDARLYAVEPNDRARETLIKDKVIDEKDLRAGIASSIDFPDGVAEFAFTSGVMIHIHPDNLLASCKEIYRCSSRWIGCIEYFSDQPEEISYRGHRNKLFKRDFGSFWLDNFPDLRVAGNGFFWKRVTAFDNTNWWLFYKS